MRRVGILLCVCLLVAGFTWPGSEWALSQRLVAPGGASPLLQPALVERALARLPHREGSVSTSAGVPVYWCAFDAGAYRLDYAYAQGAGQAERMDFSLDFSLPAPLADPPRGTVLLLHGWMMDGGSLLPWALQLADVVAALRERGEIVGPLHLMGVSYGAATAIFSARELGVEVGSVVAIESFENAAHAVRDMVPHLLGKAPESLPQQFTQRWLRWRMDAHTLEQAIVLAGEQLDLPLDAVDVGAALATVPACVLLIHGSEDRHVPASHGRRLAQAAPQAHYLEVAGEDHISLPMRLDRLAPTVIAWFDRGAAPAGCSAPLALKPARARQALLAARAPPA
jgi:pimeloyl-ACP methyl ester carboxylesterase